VGAVQFCTLESEKSVVGALPERSATPPTFWAFLLRTFARHVLSPYQISARLVNSSRLDKPQRSLFVAQALTPFARHERWAGKTSSRGLMLAA
jgi:hypothetical protein